MKKIIITIIAIVAVSILIIKRDSVIAFFQPKTEVVPIHEHKMMDEHQESNSNLFYQGEIVTFKHGGGYSYIEVKEKTEMTFWIVVERADVKKGDYIRFQKEFVTGNFESKSLDTTFTEIMFASSLEHKVSK